MALLSVMGIKAEVIPSTYYAAQAAGDFYLYNVTTQQFMNAEALTENPMKMTLAEVSTGVYTIQNPATSKFEKLGVWKGQYLWSNNWDDSKDAFFKWNFTAAGTNTYHISIIASEQDASFTAGETYYFNTANSVTNDVDEANEWALITEASYEAYLASKTIPAKYYATVADGGQYYLYDVQNYKFLKTSDHSLSTTPAELVTFTASGEKWLISGTAGKYLKIGVYKGQYLWSDGDETNTKWTLEEQGDAYYIYTNEFIEENAEVAGKTMYITGTNASATQPEKAQWVLITEADWTAYQDNKEPETPETPETPVTPVTPVSGEFALTLADGSDAHGVVTFMVNNAAVASAAQGSVVTVSIETAKRWTAKSVAARAYTGWEEACTRMTAPSLKNELEVTAGANGTWTFTMPEANVLLTADYEANPVVATMTIPAGSYKTYYGNSGMMLAEGTAEGVVMSTVSAVDAEKGIVTLTTLEEAAAETPLVFYNGTDAEQTVNLVKEDRAVAVSHAAEFKGTLTTQAMPGSGNGTDYYVLFNGHDFVWVNGAGTIAANKCWIETTGQASAARSLNIVFEGQEITGISRIENSESRIENTVYDLQGRCVAQPTKGLFIKNGKKVIVR